MPALELGVLQREDRQASPRGPKVGAPLQQRRPRQEVQGLLPLPLQPQRLLLPSLLPLSALQRQVRRVVLQPLALVALEAQLLSPRPLTQLLLRGLPCLPIGQVNVQLL